MKSKIKSLTIISQQGLKSYCVGSKYNEMVLDRIEDWSIEEEHSHASIYRGFCKREIVFETVNAPIEVEYELKTEKRVELMVNPIKKNKK